MKKELDIYDFDHTIVSVDSGTRFVIYCFLRYPWTLITLPIVAVGGLLTAIGVIGFTQFKQRCYTFVRLIPLEKAVRGFWDIFEKRVFPWWYEEKEREFVVISASPDFLLEEAKGRLGIENLISTRHNAKTGRIIGDNCRDEEKVRRLYEEFPDCKIVDVYSDSLKHDRPIFSLATGKTVHIQNGERVEFNYKEVYGEK